MPYIAVGAVTITEVMYNPAGNDAGREWIELYNNSSEAVELTSGQKGWKVNDGANHILANALTVPPGGFVIVAVNPPTFRTQYGSALSVVKSALSLNNTSGTLSLLDEKGEVVDTVSYTKDLGGFEDGMSLHRVGSIFAAGTPNPGVAPAPGVPKDEPSTQKTTAPIAAAAQTQPKKTEATQPARTIESDMLAAPAASKQRVITRESDSPVALPKPGGFLWHYILALVALVVFGVASVWYIRAENQAKRPETVGPADEFDIE